jgi:hypothetical protein
MSEVIKAYLSRYLEYYYSDIVHPLQIRLYVDGH